MQQLITLTNQEVNKAILQYALSQGVKFDGMSTEVNIIAGRGDKGVYATIELKPENTVKHKHILKEPEVYVEDIEESTDEIEKETPEYEPEDDDELFG